MDQGNLLQMLLLRGLGTTSLVGDRLRLVSQDWVRSGRLDPGQASAPGPGFSKVEGRGACLFFLRRISPCSI